MKENLIEILFEYREAFASDNEQIGAFKGNEVETMLNVERPYPPLLRIPPYQASPKAREALETYINELIMLGVFRKVGHNEGVEVTTPVISNWLNDKSRCHIVKYDLQLSSINQSYNQLNRIFVKTSLCGFLADSILKQEWLVILENLIPILFQTGTQFLESMRL
ncbi:hypothetical protein O181_037133 [Austropuccinia psidii MF-1]|uniref:Uncharacterized protein n=1 Tax=Austropuccinia psidii MF-1 TaxID=1389203 RepID=A0A9Q3D8S6_9BASI|nr:hypothetical protein [Austropuccinia psidii MF-1]